MARTGSRLATLILLAALPLLVAVAPPSDGPPACEPLVLEDPLPVGVAVPCPGIRPGALIRMDGGGSCTAAFLFRGSSVGPDGSAVDEGLFITTAGHCVLDADATHRTWTPGAGPEIADSEGRRFGEAVAAAASGLEDIALIRIDDNREADADPKMCHFGGPVGLAGSNADEGAVVRHFGHGAIVGSYGDNQPTVPGRSGVVTLVNDGDFYWAGVARSGDSGSPVTTEDGAALGVLNGGIATLVGAFPLTTQLETLTRLSDIQLELVTAPLEP